MCVVERCSHTLTHTDIYTHTHRQVIESSCFLVHLKPTVLESFRRNILKVVEKQWVENRASKTLQLLL